MARRRIFTLAEKVNAFFAAFSGTMVALSIGVGISIPYLRNTTVIVASCFGSVSFLCGLVAIWLAPAKKPEAVEPATD